MEKKRTNKSNCIWFRRGFLILINAFVKQEKKWNQNLHRKNNKTLLKSKTLLQRRTTFSHISTNSIIVNITGKRKLFILSEVLFFNNYFIFAVKMIVFVTAARRRTAAWRVRWFIVFFFRFFVFKINLFWNCKFFLSFLNFWNVRFSFDHHSWSFLCSLLFFFCNNFYSFFFLKQIEEGLPVLLRIVVHEFSSFD